MLITALYERLSHGDDDRDGESNSIKNQKLQLESFAKAQGFTNIRHYVDDDESGRFFDRSGYVQMMEDVEKGIIGVCIMKDMTRWGRDYIQVGIAMETFRKNNVRFIAINHAIDSTRPETLEMAPFINIMSEWYAKDCSNKVKSAYEAKGMSGKPIGMPPYGYMKDPDKKDYWIIDPEAAAVVRKVFQLTLEGKGVFQIACHLTDSKIYVPAYYHALKGIGKWASRTLKDHCSWNLNTVERMIRNREYCGDVVNFKTSKHIKDKYSTYKDESEWKIFEDVHEPIIDRETFETAQRVFQSMKKKRADKNGKHHPLAGLLYCSSCGGKMYIFCPEKNGKQPYAQCGNYRKTSERIERHYNISCPVSRRIIVANILELVHNAIRRIAEYAKVDKAALAKAVREMLSAQQTDEVKAQQERLAFCKARHSELEKLLNKIYEDYALGKLPEKRYESLLKTYGDEQTSLEEEIVEIQSVADKYEDDNERVEKFMKLVDRYTDFEEITPLMIREFIEKIVVHEKDERYVQTSSQKVEIHFNLIGEFEMSEVKHEPTPEELAEQERIAKVRERDHLRYLKRKAAGYYSKKETDPKATELSA